MGTILLDDVSTGFVDSFDWSEFFTAPPAVIEAAPALLLGEPVADELVEGPPVITEADDLGQLTEDDYIPQDDGSVVTYTDTTVTMTYVDTTDDPVIVMTATSDFNVV
jgi:hypothetical protein